MFNYLDIVKLISINLYNFISAKILKCRRLGLNNSKKVRHLSKLNLLWVTFTNLYQVAYKLENMKKKKMDLKILEIWRKLALYYYLRHYYNCCTLFCYLSKMPRVFIMLRLPNKRW